MATVMDNSIDIMVDFRRHIKALSWLALTSFLGQISLSVAGGIIADSSAPIDQQPRVFQTSNGVPKVNINTPSAAGVSRNTYSQFDVNSQGAILNNAHNNVQTQLGGWIQGNPSLASGTARIILNEVNSSNPSLLNGFIEVGGDKAQVVVANPSGISCDGCGFINANRASLTTGQPIINGGRLDGYLVERGNVTIQGAGLVSDQSNYTDIIARSVVVNTSIWANNLNVTAGANRVNTDQTTITPIKGIGTTPTIAIDVATLGGMYAGKIHLVGTENGVGVSNAGNIGANAGEFTLTTDGALINTGQINSTDDTSIISGEINNSGTLYAQGNSTLTTQGNITNSGTIAARNEANLHANGNNSTISSTASSLLGAGIHMDGTLGKTGNLNVSATQSIIAMGQNIAAGDLSSTAQSQDLSGSQTTGNNISLIASSGDINATNATVLAKDLMTVNLSGTLNNTGATLVANENFVINSGSLNGNGKLLSHGDLTVHLINDYIHTGIIRANDDMTLTSHGSVTNQSELTAGNELYVSATAIDNQMTGKINASTTQLTAIGSHKLTNRGLIDGGNTFINASTVNNLGTGRIYGDHVAIAATTLNNKAELSNAPVIAARGKLDIGASTITNNEHALVFSADDMFIGGGLDASHMATGQASSLNNSSATIEALGDLKIVTAILNNTNAHFSTSLKLTTTKFFEDHMGQDCSGYYAMPGCRGNSLEDHTYHDFTQHIYTPVVTQSDPAKILAGESLTLYGSNLTNDKSQIIAAGILQGDLASLTNIAAQGTKTITLIDEYSIYENTSDGYELRGPFTRNVPISKKTVTLPVTKTEGYSTVGGTETHILAHTTGSAENVTTDITLPNNSLFQTQTDPASHYLIETDPQFANYHSWLSSDYMLTQLAVDPATTLKRLGDGFYEQKLIRDQIAQLTGRRFIDGYSNEESQYQALMMQGVTFANTHQLVPGVVLTKTQIAQLTSDIVWLIEKSVSLADGSKQNVLVPQVYMRPKAGDMHADGTLIAGEQIQLDLAKDLYNSGTIAGRKIVSLTAENINNIGGDITSTNTILTADKDINNLGGTFSGNDVLSVSAGHNINIAATTSTVDNVTSNSRFTRTAVDRVAGLYVSNPNGILVASAGNNMTLTAATIINSGSEGQTSLSAKNDLTLATVTESKLNSVTWDALNYGHLASTNQVGTTIQTQGDVSLAANNDIVLRAANVTSVKGALSASAGNNLTIDHGETTRNEDSAHHTQKSGFLSSRSKSSRDTLNETRVISSTLSGENITLKAGNNITVSGSNIVATNDTNISAQNNLTIEAAQQIHDETHLYKKSKSGIFSSGGVGFTIGSQKLATTNHQQQISNIASKVGSLQGNVDLDAGKAYQQTGSDILALQGNIDIKAQQIDIEAARNLYANEQTSDFTQSGLTVAIANPVISALQTGLHMIKAANNTSNNRMKLLAAGSIALSANNALHTINASQGSKIGDKENQIASTDTAGNPTSRDANAVDKVGGINVSVSLGSSQNSSKSNQTITKVLSSNVVAGGDIAINATGAGDKSDVNIIGSQIKAGNNLILKAQDQINLLAAANTDSLNSTNSSSSSSVGVSYGTDGLMLNIAASEGEGSENGQDITWTETTVQSGGTVQLQSGGDTTLKGAIVSGQQVIADVGNNLNIQSLQDTSTYTSKQQDIGGSLSVGYGKVGGSVNYSKSATNSDYASVIEQSGIMAGDGGFQVHVNGNTNLSGAVIASTAKATNSLTTETFTIIDIENKAEYEANAISTSIGVGSQSGKPTLSGAGIGSDDDKANSTSISAISEGTINIANDNDLNEIELSRDVHVEIGPNGNPIAVNSHGNNLATTVKPIFDAEKVAKEIQAQVQITQAFGQQANQAVETYVYSKRTSLQTQLKNASNDAEKVAIQSQLSDLTTQERVMNVLIGAVTGTGGEALTKEGLSLAAEKMRQITIESSKKFAGITDGITVLSNLLEGKSDGVRGDGIATGGTRINLDLLCGAENERCKHNNDGSLDLNEKGQVQFDAQAAKMSLTAFLESDEGKKMSGITGGIQGWKGTLFGIAYKAKSWQDNLIESFGGSHDVIGGQLSGLYDEQGNATRGRAEMIITTQNIWSATGAIAVSTPFAMSELLPSAVWQAISILLGSAK